MRKMKRLTLASIALLALIGLTVGCGRSSLRIGWRETSGLRHKDASYKSFDGVERGSFRAQAGEPIVLDYALEVDEGSLTMVLVDPDGNRIWSETFHEDDADVKRLTAPSGGRYSVRIQGVSTSGGFEISWQVGEA